MIVSGAGVDRQAAGDVGDRIVAQAAAGCRAGRDRIGRAAHRGRGRRAAAAERHARHRVAVVERAAADGEGRRSQTQRAAVGLALRIGCDRQGRWHHAHGNGGNDSRNLAHHRCSPYRRRRDYRGNPGPGHRAR